MQVLPDQARAEEDWWMDPRCASAGTQLDASSLTPSRYTIYDLNVQSAIAYPNHDDVLDIATLADDATYDVKGCARTVANSTRDLPHADADAYAGGGQRISRVEVSLDDGDTWLLAHITYPEDLYRNVVASDPIYGTLDLTESDACFAWCVAAAWPSCPSVTGPHRCFWTFRCPVAKLKTSAVIMVRAMDSAMNGAARQFPC
jgi:nitrate reductase (NAD(P)H)